MDITKRINKSHDFLFMKHRLVVIYPSVVSCFMTVSHTVQELLPGYKFNQGQITKRKNARLVILVRDTSS